MKELFNGIFYINKFSNEFCNLINSGELVQYKSYLLRGSYELYRKMLVCTYNNKNYLFAELRDAYIGFIIGDIELYLIGLDHNLNYDQYDNSYDSKVITLFSKKLNEALKYKDFDILRQFIKQEKEFNMNVVLLYKVKMNLLQTSKLNIETQELLDSIIIPYLDLEQNVKIIKNYLFN